MVLVTNNNRMCTDFLRWYVIYNKLLRLVFRLHFADAIYGANRSRTFFQATTDWTTGLRI